MIIKIYDYRIVASEVQSFYWKDNVETFPINLGVKKAMTSFFYVKLKGKDCPLSMEGPKTLLGQFEKQYQKYLDDCYVRGSSYTKQLNLQERIEAHKL